MVKVLAVGRMKAGPERELFERYWQRSQPLSKSLGFGQPNLVEMRESQAGSADQRKAAEAEALLARVEAGGALIALDERGKALTTTDLSKSFESYRDAGRTIHLVIGGPDGLDTSVRKSADRIVSFGAMTMPHQLVRVLVAEQIYRVMTVLSGHPYHRV